MEGFVKVFRNAGTPVDLNSFSSYSVPTREAFFRIIKLSTMLLVIFPAKSGLILSSKSFFDTWNKCF
jgi:hypothetical protein